jgi:type I restriction enzyme, S subunit
LGVGERGREDVDKPRSKKVMIIQKINNSQEGYLNDLPKGWLYDRLKDIVSLRNDKVFDESLEDNYLELEDIEQGTGKLLSIKNTFNVESSVIKFKKGDVLFGKLRPYLEKYYLAEFDGKCTGEILAFNPISINGHFLRYCVAAPWFIEKCNTLAYGAKMPRVNWPKQLAIFDLPIPSKNEQQSIACYLDNTSSTIFKTIESKKKQLEILDALRKSIIHKAVTRGLDDSVELKESGVEYIGKIPRHWKIKRVKSISDIRYGLGQPPIQKDGGIPMVRATNIDSGKITDKDLIFIDPNDLPPGRDPYLKEDEIIVVRSGAYTGDSAIIPQKYAGAVTGYDMVITAGQVEAKFLAYCLLSDYVLNSQIFLLTLRAAQPHLNAYELGSVILSLPGTRKEQLEICDYLDSKITELDHLTRNIETQISTLEQYRKSLIHECITGKRCITEDDIKGMNE